MKVTMSVAFGPPSLGRSYLETVTYDATISMVTTTVTINVENSYRTIIDFSIRDRTYTFIVTKWQGAGFSRFFQLFHEHEPRDALYGSIVYDEDGLPSLGQGTTVLHKTRVIVQASKDIVTCLNKILSAHGRGVLDYAVWYREKYGVYDTYSHFITTLTCHCIVHTDFLAPSTRWEIVEF